MLLIIHHDSLRGEDTDMQPRHEDEDEDPFSGGPLPSAETRSRAVDPIQPSQQPANPALGASRMSQTPSVLFFASFPPPLPTLTSALSPVARTPWRAHSPRQLV